MSTESNKATLKRIYEEVINGGNLALCEELMASDYIYRASGGVELKGPAGFKQFVTMLRNAFPDMRVAVKEMIAEGDKVAHSFVLTGTFKGPLRDVQPTGKQLTLTGCTISRFANGKEVEAMQIVDRLDQYLQLGIKPQ